MTTGVPAGVSANSRSSVAFGTRTQPWEAARPIDQGSFVPWMAIGPPSAQSVRTSEKAETPRTAGPERSVHVADRDPLVHVVASDRRRRRPGADPDRGLQDEPAASVQGELAPRQVDRNVRGHLLDGHVRGTDIADHAVGANRQLHPVPGRLAVRVDDRADDRERGRVAEPVEPGERREQRSPRPPVGHGRPSRDGGERSGRRSDRPKLARAALSGGEGGRRGGRGDRREDRPAEHNGGRAPHGCALSQSSAGGEASSAATAAASVSPAEASIFRSARLS